MSDTRHQAGAAEARPDHAQAPTQPAEHKGAGLAVFVDSIEEGVARLACRSSAASGIESFSLPAALLPTGAKEGSWIELHLRVIPAPAGEDPAGLRKRLGQKDDGGDLTL